MADYPPEQRAMLERTLLGVYLSGHPLDGMTEIVNNDAITRAAELVEVEDGATVTVAGIITEVRSRTTKTKQPMAYARLEDLTGTISLTCFPKVFETYREHIAEDQIVRVTGQVSSRDVDSEAGGERTVEIIVQSVERIESPSRRRFLDRALHIQLRPDARDRLRVIRQILTEHPGDCPVHVHVNGSDRRAWFRSRLRVSPNSGVLQSLQQIVGNGQVWLDDAL